MSRWVGQSRCAFKQIPLLGLLACLLPWVLSCNQDPPAHSPERSARILGSAAGVDFSTRPQLAEGTTQYWPTPAGSTEDAAFCRARIKAQISSTDFAWETVYTPAEFSPLPSSYILHNDGVLIVAAKSRQIMGLDTATGRAIFNKDLFLDKVSTEDGPAAQRQASFSAIFLNPQGLLCASDNLTRDYVWDVNGAEPSLVWADQRRTGSGGFVAEQTSIYKNWAGYIRALDIETGNVEWEQPSLRESGGSLITTDSGQVVWWTDPRSQGKVMCLDSATGELMWSILTGSMIRQIVVDSSMNRLYIINYLESAQCRDLSTGELRWEYSWSWLLTPEQRTERFAGTDLGLIRYDIALASPAVVDGQLYLAIAGGWVLALDSSGQLQWSYVADTMVAGILAFENALLIGEEYVAPNNRMQSWQTPYCPTVPDWDNIAEASDQRKDSGVFYRFVVIERETGIRLSAAEIQRTLSTGVVPAGDKIVFGTTQFADDKANRIVAYDWLEPEVE